MSSTHTMEFFDDGRMMRQRDNTNCIEAEEMNDEELADFLRGRFRAQRYLVVVDCLSDINLSSWDYIKSVLPDSNNGSRILLTSRMRLTLDREFVLGYYKKGFLDESQSWNLLPQQVFDDEPCPDRVLEKIGKRIAKNCQGLPLSIITVGVHLDKEEKTVEYWNKVAESGNSIAYAADGAPMFERLGFSYEQMPRRLRHIFLYLGAFQENEAIPNFKLSKLWAAETLLNWEEFGSVEKMSSEPLEYFLERDLIVDTRMGNTETFRWSLHHAMWHFCCNQAKKEEFFHVLGEDTFINSKPRRLVVRKPVLFGITDSVESSTVRSILLTGPYHPYPLQNIIIWGSYKMLGVLHACSIRFYEFPIEILGLKLLRYLALTLNGGAIPPEISKLRNLMTLIVHFHHIVRSCDGSPSYLPIQIWEMQELIHLQVIGFDLPLPPHSGSLLRNLLTLSDVSPHTCTNEVLERLPNLMWLKICINFAHTTHATPMRLFDHSVSLTNLSSLSVVVTNPYFEENIGPHKIVPMLEGFSFSMENFKHLSFNGCGFPWESIEPISQLPFLTLLELRSHAFRGPSWELTSKGFNRLTYLHLEDLDLVNWTTRSDDHFFPCVGMVVILRCHKLEQIPPNFVHCPDLIKIIVRDSSRAAENWARSINMELSQKRRMKLHVSSQRGESIGNITSMYEFEDE